MPYYDYECSECGHVFEVFQNMSDDALTDCPECKKSALRRLVSGGAGIIFRGSGFYVNDSRKTQDSRESTQKSDSAKSTKTDSQSAGSKNTDSSAGSSANPSANPSGNSSGGSSGNRKITNTSSGQKT
ncbi:MAG: FmdB family zinc ribbon protein [Salinispira sp.]